MKGKWMRGIGLLLSVLMLLTLCAPMALAIKVDVSAGAVSGSEQVLFNLDFESFNVGTAPTGDAGFDSPLNAVSDKARMYIEKDGNNQVLKCYHGAPEGDQSRSPRLEKIFTTKKLTNMTISYRVKSSGGGTVVSLGIMQGGTNTAITWPGTSSKSTEWTEIKVVLDVAGDRLNMYINGEPRVEDKVISISDKESIGVRLSATVDVDGSWAMIDDFKVTTTDKDYKLVPEEPYNAADAKPESGELLVILNEDFEAQTVGKAPAMSAVGGFTGYAITDAARMYVELDTDGNKILKAYHGAPDLPDATPRTPRVDRMLTLNGINTLTLDMDVKNSGGATKLPGLCLVHKSENSPMYVSFQPLAKTTDWVHVKVRFDFAKGVATMYVDGRKQGEKKFDLKGDVECRLRINDSVQLDGSWAAIDNVLITTPDLDAGGLVSLDGTSVKWDKFVLKEEDKTGMGDVILKSHPRIYVNDWQKIRDKVATDEYAAAWYKSIISYAQELLGKPPAQYDRNLRNNINDATQVFEKNAVPLAAAYCISGDVRYKDRLYKELEAVGNWPDWGADAWLCTARINLTFAKCYDWLYNDWTAAEKEAILGWLDNQGLREAVLAYEGYGSSIHWVKGDNNWNQVCNGSNTVLALAIYDERPDVAEYILRKAAVGLPYSFHEISADGAYAEPVGYWDYGVRHLALAMAALDSSLAPGKDLPEILDFSDVRGLDKTCDFPIYYNGVVSAFNYGDGELRLVESPIMFYFANKYNKPQYTWYNLNLRDNNPYVVNMDARNATLSLLWYDPENVAAGDMPLDKFYSSKEAWGTNGISMRSSFSDLDALVLMMHAGDQKASHSALDAGGFVLDWAGKRWVYMYGRMDERGIPGGTYSWPNFHSKTEMNGHYQYYHTRGEANNTIIANPQKDMADMYYEYFAEVERYESGTNTAYGIVNMTNTNRDYEDAKRGVRMTGNRDVIVLQDEITAKKPSEFYWFVNSNAEITIAPDGKSALWTYDGDKMLVRITNGPAEAKFGVMPTSPLPTSPDPEVQIDLPGHKMYIHLTNQQTLNLTVEFVPLKEGEGIPSPQPVKALADWSVDTGAEPLTSSSLDGVVALKVDNPNAYAKGAKTYVDTANLDIKPIVQNGRTLVPVRFISENFGGTVSWDEATQTVGIKTKTKNISLQIGSDKMYIDGQEKILDVPAQTIGGRTLIPLRALVEALGKQVFWDDRGLILITDAPVTYDAAKIDAIIDLLDIRVLADGKELKFIDSEVYNYSVEIAKGAAIPTLSVISDKEAVVTQGNPATVSVGGKTYTFNFVENSFEGVLGTGSDGVVKTLRVSVLNASVRPTYQTYLDIASATSSIEWSEKYPMTGTYDGVINDETKNRWSADGIGSWITYDLGAVKNLHSVAISGYKAISRSYKFDIEVSTDGVNFTKACAEVPTERGVDRNVFQMGDVQARYVRVSGVYCSNSTWIGISEIRFYDSAQMEQDDQAAWDYYFYQSSINAMAGEVMQLVVEGNSKSGSPAPIDMSNVKFTSVDPSVASVDANGMITLHKTGKTIIHITHESMGIQTKSAVSVNVEPRI